MRGKSRKKNLFESNLPSNVQIVEKKNYAGEAFTTLQAGLNANDLNGNLLITTGDLVFEDESIKQVLSKLRDNIYIATDFAELKNNHNFPIRLAFVPRELLSKFCEQKVNPESLVSVIRFVFKNVLLKVLLGKVRIKSVKTLANLNTPEDYYNLIGENSTSSTP